MIKKLSFTTVLAAVIKKVQDNTGLRCYDSVPENAPMPFYFAEIVGQIPDPSKTMWKEKYQIFIHERVNKSIRCNLEIRRVFDGSHRAT